MPISNQQDLNVVSPENSSTTPLGPSATFTGTFIDVTDYTSVASIIDTDVAAAFQGVRYQWSTDGVNVDSEQQFAATQQLVDGRVRAQYFRVQYINGGTGQGFFRLQTLLRRGTPTGSISPAGLDITSQGHDAQVVESILNATRAADPSDIVHLRANNDNSLFVVHRENSNMVLSERTVTAQTFFSQALDLFGIFGGTRRHFSVFNDTRRGNLYIRYQSNASLTDWAVKVPPQSMWELPQSWGMLGGSINGIWDVADGQARTVEWF